MANIFGPAPRRADIAGMKFTARFNPRFSLLLIVGLFPLSASLAAEPRIDFRGDPAHHAFAVYLGSGLYRASGQNATVVNLPFSYTLKDGPAKDLKLRFPLSVGFFNFQFDDLLEGVLPDRASTISIHPGIEYPFRLNEHWTLTPYVDVGWSRNIDYSNDVFVFSTGATAIRSFDPADRDLQWLSKLFYARYDAFDTDDSDQFAALQMALDRRFGRQRELFGQSFYPRLFAAYYWYFSPVDFTRPGLEDATLSASIEGGVSFELQKPLSFLGFKLGRLGLAVRYGDNVAVWRLFAGRPF